jgi:hypothetical protein
MQYINFKLEQWKILCLWVFGHLWLFKSGLYCDRKKKNKTMKLQVTFGNKVLVISERHRLRILIVFVVWSNTLLYLFTQRMRNFVARIACFKINRQLLTFPKIIKTDMKVKKKLICLPCRFLILVFRLISLRLFRKHTTKKTV